MYFARNARTCGWCLHKMFGYGSLGSATIKSTLRLKVYVLTVSSKRGARPSLYGRITEQMEP